MASKFVPERARPMQSGLRSFVIVDELPLDCIAYEVPDNCVEPHIRESEFAVVDTNDAEPMHGELFLIEWNSGRRQIVELAERTYNLWDDETRTAAPGLAWVSLINSSMTQMATGETVPIRFADGLIMKEGLREKLVGRVGGIYQPDYRQQMGRAA
jgi:hypothetical protein